MSYFPKNPYTAFKIALFVCVTFFLFHEVHASDAFPVKTLKNHAIDTSFPDITPDTTTDIHVWLEKLPEQDRGGEEYIVIPSTGLIMPIVALPDTTSDYWRIQNGQSIEVNPYLQNGALDFPMYQVWFWEIGNKILLWHSSYFKRDEGRYKTHFQAIIGLKEGTEIWIYQKNPLNDTFNQYIYEVRLSFETSPKNNSVLDNAQEESILTLITCTPIGGVAGRWIVKAWFVEKKVEKTISDIIPTLASQLETDIPLPAVTAKKETHFKRSMYHIKKYLSNIGKVY